MASKRRNMFHKNKTQETNLPPFCALKMLPSRQTKRDDLVDHAVGVLAYDLQAVGDVADVERLRKCDSVRGAYRLADFLEAASAAGAHFRSVNTLLPPEVVNNIYGILIRKISHQVRAECGITGTTEAAEVARLLSERYGEARRPPARSAVKLLRMRRGHGETPSAFMHRVDKEFRLVKARMAAVEAAEVATAKLAVIEELLKEAVLSEMPEKLRRQLKTMNVANFGVLLAQADEEEDDYQAAKEDAATWTRVERKSVRRSDRGHERRAPPNFHTLGCENRRETSVGASGERGYDGGNVGAHST
ncbi:hypothetical protein AAG570_002731 [Ranatra chinensis]|uniref:Uncharacterized protein n=1 Tax=Ranatra chinensis TaxID=642074 RepID=A0ABD0Y8H3_9HEMI